MMKHFIAALYIEFLKIIKSKVIWVIAAAFSIAPLMAGFFMIILKDPELAEQSGLVGTQAEFAGTADWPSYLALHAQMISVGGIFVFGFVTSWVFGREYVDHTVKDLLTLPYSRAVIVNAKFVSSFITGFLLSIYIVVFGLIVGFVVGLPGWSADVVAESFYVIFIVTVLTVLLSTPVAFFASFSAGYLAPLGFVIIVLIFSQIIAAVGYGVYFPWSVPALYSGMTGEIIISPVGVGLVLATGAAGFIATLLWWRFSDQH